MTKQRILGKALELFTTKGYEGTSMEDISKAVGIKKASLYSHFGGKESIFAAIFDDILDEYVIYIHKLTAADEKESVVEQLKSIFLSFIRYCHNNVKMYFWDRYFYYPPDFLKDFIYEKTLETQELFLQRIGALVEKGMENNEIKKQPVRSCTLAYYYLMIGLSMSVKFNDEAQLMLDVEGALNGLLSGMETENKRRSAK